MEGAKSKLIVKRQGSSVVPPNELDLTVAKALFELQSSSSEIAGDLCALQLYGAREIEISSGRRVLVLVVPVPQLKSWHKIHTRVIHELGKKLGGADRSIVMIAHRRIMAKPNRKAARNAKVQRPRSRTLTAVHENWLEDLVYPTEIVGKRMRVKNGSKSLKVLLDPKDQTTVEAKVDILADIYRKLTGKDISFEFPTNSMVVEEETRRK